MEKNPISEREIRQKKREELLQSGVNPYPSTAERTSNISAWLADFEQLATNDKTHALVGRIKALRRHGKATFGEIADESGSVQFFVSAQAVPEGDYALLTDQIDLGDFVSVTGTAFLTQRQERTLRVSRLQLLTKALRPLPDQWSGLHDPELRARKRYLDFIANPAAKNIISLRSKIVREIRNFFDERGYQEVETPELQPIYGGGFARPFTTHHNALDIDLYLRVSDEMYLKRLVVGGFEKIYEFCRDFRNEGIDQTHNPEFTQLEAMTAYQDYRYSMDLVEAIYEHVMQTVIGSTEVTYRGNKISLARPWQRVSFYAAVSAALNQTLTPDTPVPEIRRIAEHMSLDATARQQLVAMQSNGEIAGLLFEELVEKTLIQPTIVYDYPIELSPLAKQSAAHPKLVERFEHFIGGNEHGNHYSELNDPVELYRRFIMEKDRAAAGFDEAHQVDMDFVEAIEYGMPPVTGIGIGIDRMTMLLADAASIRDVIAFPTVRPLKELDS